MSEGRDFNEIVDIGLNLEFLYDENKKFLGYEVPDPQIADMQSYKLQLRRNIDTHKSVIELTAFLFPRDIEELLQKLTSAYSAFMNSVCSYSKLESNDIVEPYKDEELRILDYNTCTLEKTKNEFLKVFKEISDKDILEKIKDNLRIKE